MNFRRKGILGSFVLLALIILSACQSTELKQRPQEAIQQGQEPIRVTPVNVQEAYINIQAIEPQAVSISSGNLFENGGFENGLDGWTACSSGAIKASGDAYEGSSALEVVPNNCFYKSAEVSSGQDLILSCYAKITEGSGWTGMGLGFADSNWTTIDVDIPATVITGTDYARYDVKFTAPANTKYASMWLFSENPAVVDNCSLMLEVEPPPPPPTSGDNLLENGDFETLVSDKPTEWSIGCGGYVTSVAGRSGKGLSLQNGVCADQSLSASDIASLSGKEFTYSCYAKNAGGYASISIFFDGTPTSKQIPVSSNYQLIEITGTAPQASNGFVSIYSNGNLTIDQCALTTAIVPPPNNDNLLENGAFETLDVNSKPVNWTKGCGGSYTTISGRSGKGLSLSGGACVDQALSSDDLSALANKQYTYSCYAKNTGGYASMSIFFDDLPVSVVIPQSNDFQPVEITSTAPSANSGFVSVYSEAGLTVDDCSLTSDSSNTGPIIINESRVLNVQGNSFDIEGNRIVVGNPLDDSRGENTGKVTVYSKTTSGWTMTSEIFLSDAVTGDRFGYQVKLYRGKIYATALGDTFYPTQRNLLHIFKDDGNNNWVKETSLGDPEWTPYQNQISAPTYSSFGSSLEVSEDFVIVSALVSYNGNTFGTFANLYIYSNRIGESYRLLKDVALGQSLLSKIQYDNQNLYISYRNASRNGTGSNFVNIRGENVGGENNWGSVDTLSYFPGRISAGLDSRFFRLNDFFFANNFEDGNMVYQRSTNATDGTDSWANIGKMQEIFSSFPLADNSVVIGGIGNNALFAKREGASTILASENPIYVIDVSNSTPTNWSVNYTLVPRNVTSDEVFGEHVTDGNTFALATRDGSTNNGFQSILTFDIP